MPDSPAWSGASARRPAWDVQHVPQRTPASLGPGNTTETEGLEDHQRGLDSLVTFDVKSRAVTYDGAAESVTSSDNVHWTIKLKPGWTFHDGTPVTAAPTSRHGTTPP